MYDKICKCCGKVFRGYVQDEICLECMEKKYMPKADKGKDSDNEKY